MATILRKGALPTSIPHQLPTLHHRPLHHLLRLSLPFKYRVKLLHTIHRYPLFLRIPGIYLLPEHLHLLLQALHLNLIYRMLALYLHILYSLYILKHCALKHLLLQLRHLIGLTIFMYLFNYFSSIYILDFL